MRLLLPNRLLFTPRILLLRCHSSFTPSASPISIRCLPPSLVFTYYARHFADVISLRFFTPRLLMSIQEATIIFIITPSPRHMNIVTPQTPIGHHHFAFTMVLRSLMPSRGEYLFRRHLPLRHIIPRSSSFISFQITPSATLLDFAASDGLLKRLMDTCCSLSPLSEEAEYHHFSSRRLRGHAAASEASLRIISSDGIINIIIITLEADEEIVSLVTPALLASV